MNSSDETLNLRGGSALAHFVEGLGSRSPEGYLIQYVGELSGEIAVVALGVLAHHHL